MKKFALLLLAIMPAFVSNGQSAKVVTAFRYLKDYENSKDAESLTRAKEAIDLASEHADTKDQAKTQVYRGQIYYAIFDNKLRAQNEKQTSIADPKKREAIAYQNTTTVELNAAYDAFVKAKTLDVKGNYTGDINNGISNISIHFSNKAVYDYNAKNYTEALSSFEKTYEINGAKDTNSLYNSAVTAEYALNYDKAKLYYQKMIDRKQGQGNTYSVLMSIYLTTKDTLAGMDILKKGRVAYPNDINLLLNETDFYIKTNQNKEALANLNQALIAKPNDPILYFARGNMYDNLANPKDVAGKELEKPKDYEEKIKMAETDYKKAIELKSDYFDALYNLGVLYNNRGVAINKQADKITDNAKYAAENAKATAEFTKAMPMLEKALEVNPKDRGTMVALKQIYARMQQTEKLKAINEKLKN